MIKPIDCGEGKWKIRACAGYDAADHKKIVSKTVQLNPKKTPSAQLKEAEKLTARMESDLQEGKISAAKAITLKEYVSLWKESYCQRKGLAAGTIGGYEDLLKWRIEPQLGRLPLRDIKPLTLNQFFNQLAAEKLSGTTQRKYFNLLHLILKTATQEQLIPFNPCDNIQPPQKDTKEHKVYNEDQVSALVQALDTENTKWRAFVLLALDSQMRKGELVGLNWQDINLKEQKVTVRQSYAYTHGQQYLKAPKTASGFRTITISPETIAALKAWKKDQAIERLAYTAEADLQAVFTQATGKRMNVCSPTKFFPEFLKRHNLPNINLHGLRHTGASLMIAHQEDMARISRRLGHSRISTTTDIYVHGYAEKDSELTAVMSSIMYKKASSDS